MNMEFHNLNFDVTALNELKLQIDPLDFGLEITPNNSMTDIDFFCPSQPDLSVEERVDECSKSIITRFD